MGNPIKKFLVFFLIVFWYKLVQLQSCKMLPRYFVSHFLQLLLIHYFYVLSLNTFQFMKDLLALGYHVMAICNDVLACMIHNICWDMVIA